MRTLEITDLPILFCYEKPPKPMPFKGNVTGPLRQCQDIIGLKETVKTLEGLKVRSMKKFQLLF